VLLLSLAFLLLFSLILFAMLRVIPYATDDDPEKRFWHWPLFLACLFAVSAFLAVLVWRMAANAGMH